MLDARLAQQARRVDTKAGLRIGEAPAGRAGNPEVGHAVGPIPCCRRAVAQMQARADHDRLGPLPVRREQRGDVLGAVLAVAVERDHRARAERERTLRPVPQARAFSEIHGVAQQFERQALERGRSRVRGAVIHHDQRTDLAQRTLGHVADRRGFVEGRNDGDVSGRVHRAYAIAPLTGIT